MSMASEAAIAAPMASAIWSLKYGKCHFSGDSTTPSSEMNSDATTFLIRTSSESKLRPNIRQAKYPGVALLRIGETRKKPHFHELGRKGDEMETSSRTIPYVTG